MKSYYEFNYGLELDVGEAVGKVKQLWNQHGAPILHQVAQHSDDARKSLRNIRHTLKEGSGLVGNVKGLIGHVLKGGDEVEEGASKAKEAAEKGWSTTHKVAAGVGATAGVGALGYGAYRLGKGSNN